MKRFVEDLSKVPVLRVLFPLLIGILAERSKCDSQFPYWLVCAAVFFFTLALTLRSRMFELLKLSHYLVQSALFLLIISAGIFHCRCKSYTDAKNVPEGSLFISGVITTVPEEKERSIVVTLEAECMLSSDSVLPLDQRILLYIPKDSLLPVISPGEHWLIKGRIQKIRNNGNPGEFDYKGYMLRKGISRVMFAESGYCKLVKKPLRTKLRFVPDNIRSRIQRNWDLHDPDHAVLGAITLGDKSMITDATRDAFAGSGAMHLLAVSGLHVGMIWWILDLLIAFPRRKSFFRIIKVILILAILWMYAGITGFSESVTRSVTMFSLISLSRAISRNSNIYNTLFLSAFILLVIDPRRIADPGFQLSYLAVFGIVTIHPVLVKIMPVSNKLLRRVTDLVFVSIAAQLATLPVSLLYFHQFPVYFIFTNILAIPLVSILLAMFVVFSPFFILEIHPEFFLWILEKLTHLLNQFVGFISTLPGSTIEAIPMSPVVTLLLIMMILSLAGFAIYRRVSWLVLSLGFACSIFSLSAIMRIPDPPGNELYVYNFSDCTAISSLTNSHYTDYLFYQQEKPVDYSKSYLQSRGKMNRKFKEYYLHEIETGSNMKLSTGNSKYNSVLQLCDGAWGIHSGGKKLLICGDCRVKELEIILEKTSWDIVVFRASFPWLSDTHSRMLDGVVCIADGTTKSYELNRIKAIIPDLFITSEAGAWSNYSQIQ